MSAPQPKKPRLGVKLAVPILKGPDLPEPAALQTDLTTIFPQPIVSAAAPAAPTGPLMFGKRMPAVTQKAPKSTVVSAAAPAVTKGTVAPTPILAKPANQTRRNRPAKSVVAPPPVPAVLVAPVVPTPVVPIAPVVEPAVVPEPAILAEPNDIAPCKDRNCVAERLLPAIAPPKSVAVPKKTVPTNQAPDDELSYLQEAIDMAKQQTPYQEEEPEPYYPEDRKGFTRYIKSRYKPFTLPPRLLTKTIDPNACSSTELQTYKYQAFVREYMRQASPYRGVLVYHGLGSGKTCTSIAAAEALYSQDNKKIIIMTPTALRENFLNELMFCGFRHYRLKNTWYSFSLTNVANRLFAQTVVGLPDTLINSILKRSDPARRVFWMPDLNEPEDASNYETLEDWERSAIREQLYAFLQSKFTFIGYTGFTQKALKDIATKNPTFFDNAVIIIDEVHNLTRLMAGKLDKYLILPKGAIKAKQKGQEAAFQRKQASYEPVGVDTWVPKLQEANQQYDRAFLFYRLLCQAKNSKIIALSGTPIVNQPVELGILTNILHGYFHCVKDTIPSTDDTVLAKAREILKLNIRVNFYSITKADGASNIFFTILDEGYVKVIDDDTGDLQGLFYVGDDAEPRTIQELYASVQAEMKTHGITLGGKPTYEALPLLPPTVQAFNDNFIETKELKVKNRITFVKRISGLFSYYKGSKEDLMPKVTVDENIMCPFSSFAMPKYAAVRKEEIENQPKGSVNPLDEALGLAEKESNSYRFKSRAVCNFAFPEDITRPFPGKQSELLEALETMTRVYGDAATDVTENPDQVKDLEAQEAVAAEEDKTDEEIRDQTKDLGFTKEVAPYKERLAKAIAELIARKDTLFKMDDAAPEEQQLKTYSRKFYEIIQRILSSRGSSLVYSAFKTVEGIGVLGIAMEANGFQQIRIIGAETDLRLDEETERSLRERPEQPRYIMYSGDDSIAVRQILINLFNSRLDKLPPKIATVLRETQMVRDAPREGLGNLTGQLCRVFMITGAGAEGLSLRNVRTVHIMEPYWNKVRTDQVKGRAVRICSHSDLPYDPDPAKNERTVEIYTYQSVFDKSMVVDETIIKHDLGLTSDQHIYGLASAKEAVSSDLLQLVKSGAVDCELNQSENDEGLICYAQPGTMNDFLYDPRLDEDTQLSDLKIRIGYAETAAPSVATLAKPVRAEAVSVAKPFRKGGVDYFMALDIATGKQLFYLVDDTRRETPLGEMVKDPTTGKFAMVFFNTE